MSAARTADPAALSFTEAMKELEAVLHRIEGEEIDIDQLGMELGRAAKLLEVCREKIRRAEVEVQQIVEKIEEDEPVARADAAPAAPAPERPVAEPRREAVSSTGVLWSDGDPDDDIPF